MKRVLALLAASTFLFLNTVAQNRFRPDHDSSYYRSFRGAIIGRVFISRNYSLLKLSPPGTLPVMTYHANTPLNLGIGFSYRYFSLSFSKGLDFLKSDDSKGKTHATDLQLHIYKRKWSIDALASFYHGYYLGPRGLAAPDGQTFYTRPDIGMSLVGTSVYRILNDQRFSYGAGLSQNAWQQKSAGSFLVGGEAFYIDIKGDSALAPQLVDSSYSKKNIHLIHLFEMGPGIGYAYSLVLHKHYFLLGSLNLNINLCFSREIGNGIRADQIGFSPNYLLRFGGGYNSSKWGLNLIWISSRIHTEGKNSEYAYTVNAGSYRLVYARRLAVNHHMKQIIGTD